MPKLPPSEIFENYIQLALDRGLIKNAEDKETKEIKDYKNESYARLDSHDIKAIEALYGIKPDSYIEYEHNIAEAAHPKSVVVSQSYDKLNGVVENINERNTIMCNIALKKTDGKLTNYKYAKQELTMQLVRIANEMDAKDFEEMAILADDCMEKLSNK